jgi:uncharacterized membrane protein YbjE (DUF340 family)
MLTVVIIMMAGIAIGYFIRNFKNLVKIADKLTMWAIYLLLFLLGVAIGANEVIMKNLPTLGLKAMIISIGGVAGSVLLAWAVYHFLFKSKRKEHEG